MNFEKIIKSNQQIVLNYSVENKFNGRYEVFNGEYPVLYNNQLVAKIEWSNNRISNGLNNVIHGYLRPNKEDNKLIPNGLFIGTNWFKTSNGLSVSNSVTTIFGIIFIVSIEVVEDNVKIILTNPNKKSKNTRRK